MPAQAKYLAICDEIIRGIREGNPAPGERLPTERELAERFKVHRMTVREATDLLTRRGFVEKRLPKGVFVRKIDRSMVAAKSLNLICAAAPSPQTSLFVEYGSALAVRQDMHPRPLLIAPGDEHMAADAIVSRDPSIVFNMDWAAQGEISKAMRRAAGRAVALGVRLEHMGVPSVVGDDQGGIRLAVEHLYEEGHRRVGLVCSRAARDIPLMEVQIQFWKEALYSLLGAGDARREDVDAHIIRLTPVPVGGTLVGAYEAVKRYFKTTKKPATAMIGLDEGVMDGIAAAAYRSGVKIPEELSLVSYAGTYYSAMAVPPRTSVDVSMKEHIEAAIEMIESQARGELGPDGLLRVIRPRLVKRESVARVG